MKRRILLIGFLCLVNLTMPCFAKEWRNIFPLKTTRTEVIKLLGNPQNLGTEAEYFNVEDGRIKIGWMRPDCYSQNTIQEDTIKSNFLVYQITFFPKEPLPNNFIQKAEMTPASDLFAVYWGNCLKGGNGTFSCNLMTPKYGFGYSNSQDGVAALYFIPTEKELADWEEKLEPCSVEQK